ncbi:MAG TPA: hypothetical protein PK447_06800 [Ignavibacteria bacterium]|nr:hypothetical protein [Ignavibacteria bacterium]
MNILSNEEKLLLEIERHIVNGDVPCLSKDTMEWGGADVIICSVVDDMKLGWIQNQPMVISMQLLEPKRRLVVTKYAKELSWLFYQMREAAVNKIDFISKYDFYGLLAQSAINFMGLNKEFELQDLLLAVFYAGKEYLRDAPDLSSIMSDEELEEIENEKEEENDDE